MRKMCWKGKGGTSWDICGGHLREGGWDRMPAVEGRHAYLGTWLSLAVRKPNSRFALHGLGGRLKSYIWETSGVGVIDVINRNSSCKLAKRWGWSWDETQKGFWVLSLLNMVYTKHKQCSLGVDLSCRSIHYQPCFMSIMIIKHLCFLGLKKNICF